MTGHTASQRIYYFDNAKFLLILLVVIGHMVSPYRHESTFLQAFYKFIYTFHMPAFILIAGYFAKNVFKKGYVKKVCYKVLFPYFIFQLLYTAYFTFQTHTLEFTLFDPHWTLWFLLSFVGWHFLLLLFAKVKYSLLISIGIGVFIGFIPTIGTFLSLSRTFVFFPLFLLGYYLEKEHFSLLRQRGLRILSIYVLGTLLICYMLFLHDVPRDWLLASSSYTTIGVNPEIGAIVRLMIYGLVFLTTFAFLSVVPWRRTFYSKLGERTLYIYLLHGIVVKLLDTTPVIEVMINANVYVFLFLFGTMITFILGSNPVTKVTRPIIEPRRELQTKCR
ncbi:acyltransferase family protein [Salirhabdus salicampi]|uniref:acyltransferase family protein n=1 Tax=Salirhabdus salicampi TaxID=476102 RepID=UPI0020C50D43|nr:acyltransferase family protein [Salirhabdus salicampi]